MKNVILKKDFFFSKRNNKKNIEKRIRKRSFSFNLVKSQKKGRNPY